MNKVLALQKKKIRKNSEKSGVHWASGLSIACVKKQVSSKIGAAGGLSFE